MSLTYHTSKHKGGSGLTVLKEISRFHLNGRIYKYLLVKTREGLEYYCLRLYNAAGKFIKQFLFEDDVAKWLKETL